VFEYFFLLSVTFRIIEIIKNDLMVLEARKMVINYTWSGLCSGFLVSLEMAILSEALHESGHLSVTVDF
jgi:hypothetical protein